MNATAPTATSTNRNARRHHMSSSPMGIAKLVERWRLRNPDAYGPLRHVLTLVAGDINRVTGAVVPRTGEQALEWLAGRMGKSKRVAAATLRDIRDVTGHDLRRPITWQLDGTPVYAVRGRAVELAVPRELLDDILDPGLSVVLLEDVPDDTQHAPTGNGDPNGSPLELPVEDHPRAPARDDVADELVRVVEGIAHRVGIQGFRAWAAREVCATLRARGWTPAHLELAAHRKSWDGAGPGALRRWLDRLVDAPLPALAARPAPFTSCPEHPGTPAGRCEACEEGAVPAPSGWRGGRVAEIGAPSVVMDTTQDALPLGDQVPPVDVPAAPVTLPPAPAVPPGEPRKLFTPCQDHPSEPAGRCRHCEARAVEPTSEFEAARAALRARRRAS